MNVKQFIMEEFERPCCIRGYHIYQEVWTAPVGKELVCEREPHNSHDHYAVAVKRMGIIIGHLPRKLSKQCSLFLRRDGSIFCTVSVAFTTSILARAIVCNGIDCDKGPLGLGRLLA